MENKQEYLDIIQQLQGIQYGDSNLKYENRKPSKEEACEILLNNGFDPFKYALENGITIPEVIMATVEGGDDPDEFYNQDSDEPSLNDEVIKIQAQNRDIMEQKRESVLKHGFVSSQTKQSDLNLTVSNNDYDALLKTRKEKLAKLKEQGFSYTVKPCKL